MDEEYLNILNELNATIDELSKHLTKSSRMSLLSIKEISDCYVRLSERLKIFSQFNKYNNNPDMQKFVLKLQDKIFKDFEALNFIIESRMRSNMIDLSGPVSKDELSSDLTSTHTYHNQFFERNLSQGNDSKILFNSLQNANEYLSRVTKEIKENINFPSVVEGFINDALIKSDGLKEQIVEDLFLCAIQSVVSTQAESLDEGNYQIRKSAKYFTNFLEGKYQLSTQDKIDLLIEIYGEKLKNLFSKGIFSGNIEATFANIVDNVKNNNMAAVEEGLEYFIESEKSKYKNIANEIGVSAKKAFNEDSEKLFKGISNYILMKADKEIGLTNVAKKIDNASQTSREWASAMNNFIQYGIPVASPTLVLKLQLESFANKVKNFLVYDEYSGNMEALVAALGSCKDENTANQILSSIVGTMDDSISNLAQDVFSAYDQIHGSENLFKIFNSVMNIVIAYNFLDNKQEKNIDLHIAPENVIEQLKKRVNTDENISVENRELILSFLKDNSSKYEPYEKILIVSDYLANRLGEVFRVPHPSPSQPIRNTLENFAPNIAFSLLRGVVDKLVNDLKLSSNVGARASLPLGANVLFSVNTVDEANLNNQKVQEKGNISKKKKITDFESPAIKSKAQYLFAACP